MPTAASRSAKPLKAEQHERDPRRRDRADELVHRGDREDGLVLVEGGDQSPDGGQCGGVCRDLTISAM